MLIIVAKILYVAIYLHFYNTTNKMKNKIENKYRT